MELYHQMLLIAEFLHKLFFKHYITLLPPAGRNDYTYFRPRALLLQGFQPCHFFIMSSAHLTDELIKRHVAILKSLLPNLDWFFNTVRNNIF